MKTEDENEEKIIWDFSDLDDEFGGWNYSDPTIEFSRPFQTVDDNNILEGYGPIPTLDEYLNNSNGVIELLEQAKDREQFKRILVWTKPEAHDKKLLEYLKSKKYDVEDYISMPIGNSFIFEFRELFEYVLNKSTEENIKQLLGQVAYVDENIANIIAKRDDRQEIIQSNYHLRDKMVVEKTIDFFKNNPDKVNFDFIAQCDLDTNLIKELVELGYVINENSPDNIMQNNQIMREVFLASVEMIDQELIADIDREMNDILGSYSRLYTSNSNVIFNNDFMDMFNKEELEQIIKYIVLSDYEINFSQMIKDGNTGLIKNIYDSLNNKKEFNLNLFVNIVYKYNLYSDIFKELDEKFLEDNKENLKILFEHKGIEINGVDDITNINQTIFDSFDRKIKSANNTLDLKNVICNMLVNQTYLETKKGLLEAGNSEKLEVLKNSIQNPKVNKEIDSFIILSDLLSKIDGIEDINELQRIANSINNEILENGVNEKWTNYNEKIMRLYNHEINSRMTDFREHLTDSFYDATDYTFNDGVSVNGKRVEVAHINAGEEFNAFIHVLNAYRNGGIRGTVESLKHPKFIGQSYMCLTGISDEYNRICINRESAYEIKVLYSHIPNGDLLCASNRDTGIVACQNSKNISTRLPKNMMPFRRLVRNTEIHGSETYNEYDVFRDNLVPSGIAFMGEHPTEQEINAAAYLGVPLVKIDDLRETFRTDEFTQRGFRRLKHDESFYHIKEHGYEDMPVHATPNDSFDQAIIDLTSNIRETEQSEQIETVDISIKKDERGDTEYVVSTQTDEYSVTPIYEYIDSERRNIDAVKFEKDFAKMRLYDILGVEPKLKCVYGKYPNGQKALTMLENNREENEIDKCIRYLVQGLNSWEKDIEFLSPDEQSIMNSIAEIDEETYIKMFENIIAVSSYIEPRKFIQDVLTRKKKIEGLLVDLSKENQNEKDESQIVSTRTLGEQVISEMGDTILSDEYDNLINSLERHNLERKDGVDKD